MELRSKLPSLVNRYVPSVHPVLSSPAPLASGGNDIVNSGVQVHRGVLRETGENVAVKVRGLFVLPPKCSCSWLDGRLVLDRFLLRFFSLITAVYPSSADADVLEHFRPLLAAPRHVFCGFLEWQVSCMFFWSECKTKRLFATCPRQSGSIPRGGARDDVGSAKLESAGVVLAEV